jgi:hypothetical protein
MFDALSLQRQSEKIVNFDHPCRRLILGHTFGTKLTDAVVDPIDRGIENQSSDSTEDKETGK